MSLFPPITPLKRLLVTDGLLLTAERWQVAHGYHRQRQNLHFQALCQPGIVCGLGISPIPPPADVPVQYRDNRWLQIQPGIAIDQNGDPIIVPQSINYHIAAEPTTDPLLVYLVVSFVDPDRLDSNNSHDIVQETFRVEEKISPPDASEVELCRVVLSPGPVQVRSPINCLSPQANELDLRHRQLVHLRATKTIQVGQLTLDAEGNSEIATAFDSLLAALEGLYPSLSQASTNASHISPVSEVPLRQGKLPETILNELLTYDLLYLPHRYCQEFQLKEVEILRQYLAAGGVVLVAVTTDETDLDDLMHVRTEIARAIPLTTSQPEGVKMRRDLERELVDLDECILQETRRLTGTLRSLIPQGSQAGRADADGRIAANHPLRRQPFQFGRFPLIRQAPTELFNWGGVLLVVGDVISAWGGEASLSMEREEIRSAQELGVNILHFAWQRRHLMHCLTPPTLQPSSPPPPTRGQRMDVIFDQLEDKK
jgi:hypothetical protein